MLLKSDKEKLEKVRDYLLSNMNTIFNVRELGALFCLSPATLRRQFQQYFQIPIYKYIHRQRMEHAKKLLLECTHTISEISELVGYSESSNFSHAFKNYFGVAPSKMTC